MSRATIRCKCGEEIDITDRLDADLRLIVDDQAREIRELRKVLADEICGDPIVGVAVAMGEENEGDQANDPEYQAFVEEQAKHCRCTRGPCEGVLAGGPCDEWIDDEDDDEDEEVWWEDDE